MTINGRLPTRLIIASIGVLFSSVATAQEGNPRADAKNPELDRARQLIRARRHAQACCTIRCE